MSIHRAAASWDSWETDVTHGPSIVGTSPLDFSSWPVRLSPSPGVKNPTNILAGAQPRVNDVDVRAAGEVDQRPGHVLDLGWLAYVEHHYLVIATDRGRLELLE